MKGRKGQSQPEIVAAAFLLLYMVLGSPFLYQVFLIVTQVSLDLCGANAAVVWFGVNASDHFRFGLCPHSNVGTTCSIWLWVKTNGTIFM